jgi:hypothetical protein
VVVGRRVFFYHGNCRAWPHSILILLKKKKKSHMYKKVTGPPEVEKRKEKEARSKLY